MTKEPLMPLWNEYKQGARERGALELYAVESMPGDAGSPKSQLRANRRTMTATTSTTLNAMKILDIAFPPLHSRH